jgi:TetR/AcrR family transcriptional regulator
MPRHGTASRGRILKAARAEFARYGYAGARVARIARDAGVNKQLLYYYFGSKVGLHQAASSPAAGWVTEPTPGGAPERLRHAIDGLFSTLRDHPELVALLIDRVGDLGGAQSAARDYVAQVVHHLRDLISEGQGMGYFADRLDPGETAGKAVVLCAGYLALESCLPHPTRAPETWSAEVSALLLRALAW